MLTISRDLHDKIIAHARQDHPDEACGVIAGPLGSDRPDRFIPMENAARSPTFYEFDSKEQLKVWREMDDRDEEPVVIYHSHTMTEAYPSRTDISYASEPQARTTSWSRPASRAARSSAPIASSTARSPRNPSRSLRNESGARLRQVRRIRTGVPEDSLEEHVMAIEVRIPTILRTYTGGAKVVEGSGSTLAS